MLSGDAVHFKSNWDNRRVPSINADKEQTATSMQRIADIIAKEKAQLWINHDKAQRDTLKMAPDFYDQAVQPMSGFGTERTCHPYSSDVRCRGQSGKHLLLASISGGAGARPDHPITGHRPRPKQRCLDAGSAPIKVVGFVAMMCLLILGSSMRRREFITLLGGAAAAWPHTAPAQQAGRQYRIAILGAAGSQIFLDELGQAGFVEGHNLEIDSRGIGVPLLLTMRSPLS